MSNPEIKLEGIMREQSGKGYARKLRKNGMIPAIVYSKGKETISFAISPKETSKILLGPQRRNTLIHLILKNKDQENKYNKKVIIRDLQIDLVMRNLKHVDFIEIDLKKPIITMIPVTLLGKCKSVVAGGQLEQIRHKIKIKSLPKFIPEKITFDVTNLEFGSTYSSKIKLPETIKLAEELKSLIITIKHPRGIKDEEEKTTISKEIKK